MTLHQHAEPAADAQRTPWRWFLRGLTTLFGVAACSSQSEIITPPPPPPTGFTIEFKPDPEDIATAQALGWQNGIPDVNLTLTPEDMTKTPRTYQSAVDGTVEIDDLPAGVYVAYATRWLTDGERALLPANDDALGFVGKNRLDPSAASRQTLPMPADRRRSLVISEWAFNKHGYNFGGFLEIVNNADTTIYLDGIIVGQGWDTSQDFPNFPCSLYEVYRNDAEGIWSREFGQFPGRGQDYPLPPGAVVVVATDAIDHRPFESTGLDLSQAAFEFIGSVDVDNPSVPNMVDIGLVTDPLHGIDYSGLISVPFLSLTVDIAALPKAQPSTHQWARFPASKILDALAIGSNYLAGYPECSPLVHPRFDRQESHARESDEIAEYEHSVSRRRISSSVSGGRVRLQHTRSGDADFIRTTRTPGVVP